MTKVFLAVKKKEMFYSCMQSVAEIFGGGLPPGSPKPGPISDQTV